MNGTNKSPEHTKELLLRFPGGEISYLGAAVFACLVKMQFVLQRCENKGDITESKQSGV